MHVRVPASLLYSQKPRGISCSSHTNRWIPGTTIPYLSTAHSVPPHPTAVPHIPYHHTLPQYRTFRATIPIRQLRTALRTAHPTLVEYYGEGPRV
eukprot:3176703-Rhodomonas_salina.1